MNRLYSMGVLRNVRSEFGKRIRKDYEAGNISISRHSFLQKEIREDGVCNTLDSVQKDNLLAVDVGLECIGGIYGSVSKAYQRGVYEGGARCLKSSAHDDCAVFEVNAETDKEGLSKNEGIFVKISESLTVYAVWYPKKQCYIAIRKLTPKECFRLQGWTDDYFEKAKFVCSDSQLYKQAGNGVTVSVIKAIADKLRIEEDEEK